MMADCWNFFIDTGGTFTDCIAVDAGGQSHHAKILSSSRLRGTIVKRADDRTFKISLPYHMPDDFLKGYTLVRIQKEHAEATIQHYDSHSSRLTLSSALPGLSAGSPFEIISQEEAPVLAMRLITGTLLHEPLPPAKMHLATTRATNALLEQHGARTLFLTTKGFKDLLTIRYQQRPDLFALHVKQPPVLYQEVLEIDERIDADGNIVKPLDEEALSEYVSALKPASFDAVAICLINSYKNPCHEELAANILQKQHASFITQSHRVSNRSGLVPRAETTVINAYLAPVMKSYIQAIQKVMAGHKLYLLNSTGGLSTPEAFEPKDSLLSGPAGGVVGASTMGQLAGYHKLLTFDMGGTSTDVARFDRDFIYRQYHTVGHANLAAPALAIETVAAGGGSICSFDGYSLKVGPESAGATPGPACYSAGGPLTITDANLLLGRIQPSNFSIPIALDRASEQLDAIYQSMQKAGKTLESRENLLKGFLDIANERMAETIKKISTRKGFDPSAHALVAFGGAGGQHACSVAELLDVETILFPLDAGLLSAFGLRHARLEHIEERELLASLEEAQPHLSSYFNQLADHAVKALKQQGVDEGQISINQKLLFIRFQGQQHALEITYEPQMDIYSAFRKAYRNQYGHWIEDRTIEIQQIRLIAVSRTVKRPVAGSTSETGKATPDHSAPVWVQGAFRDLPVFKTASLQPGHIIKGPALVLDPHSTLMVEKGWKLHMKNSHLFELSKISTPEKTRDFREEVSPLSLELFTNRFTAIAEEMGEKLKRTAISVNIRERMDFSCALLNARGELIVNAPHIPVHLGALGTCVRTLMQKMDFSPGDVVVTNHPAFGGSHLPDVTVVTPVYVDETHLIGFAANRAHHAEIGGEKPGSMPPRATSLTQEGIIIPPRYLIEGYEPRWDELENLLTGGPYPTRALQENMADLEAAVAANNQGVTALQHLCLTFGIEKVTEHMDALKKYAAYKMQHYLQQYTNRSFSAMESLDDGSTLAVSWNFKGDRLQLDFTGTSSQHPGNLNATPAIVNSVVMYVVRVLLAEELPLNDGLLEPVDIVLPECLLNPRFPEDLAQCPAIVGGNTEVSQRLTDVLLKPFGLVACSQGTMNNVLFGNNQFGYYETIGGGTGAGADFHGAAGVHHHMSNTRGTDPETLERHYPVLLRRYGLRNQSGGTGKFRGGEGVFREFEFKAAVSLSVLTQHRRVAPYGIKGGKDGAKGCQKVIRADGTEIPLQPVDGIDLNPGDRFIIETPGGGGFGTTNSSIK